MKTAVSLILSLIATSALHALQTAYCGDEFVQSGGHSADTCWGNAGEMKPLNF